MGFQNVIICGNVGKNPVQNEKGNLVKFSICENDTWHKIKCFDNLAGICLEYVKAGDKLCIQGKISYFTYTDEFNNKSTTVSINANRIEFMSKKVKKVFESEEIPKLNHVPIEEMPF